MVAPDPRLRRRKTAREGFALLIALVALTILAVLVADLHETTGTSFAAAMAERDQLRAEYMAKSGINLTRMVIAQERMLRMAVAAPYQMITKAPPPQLPVWHFANMILKPFADFDGSKEDAASAGFDLDMSEGLGKTNATFEIFATAENGKINLNDPHLANMDQRRLSVAQLFHSLISGGPQSPNKYDVLFSQFDEKGQLNSRLDLIANVIDWWDSDDQRTNYDPVMNVIQSSGGEDLDYYRSQTEPYIIKNAPFDTLEELRLVRGMTDDVWATFVEPDLEDPSRRLVTIWGGQSINVNEAEAPVLLARVCSYQELRLQPLCGDPIEQAKFVQIINLARSFRIPVFSKRSDFVEFLTGKMGGLIGDFLKNMGGSLGSLMGGGMGGASAAGTQGGGGSSGWPFTPLVFPQVPADLRQQLEQTFTRNSRYFTIESVGRSGHSQRRIRAVINIDSRWTAPKPNAATMPPLGIFSYYRSE